jgi:hypothetical protein
MMGRARFSWFASDQLSRQRATEDWEEKRGFSITI